MRACGAGKHQLSRAGRRLLRPYRGHADAPGRLLVAQRVLDQHTARRRHAEPDRHAPQHARIGLGPQLPEHRHVLDRQQAVEQRCDAEHAEHALGVGQRRVGQDELASWQPAQRIEIVGVPMHPPFQARQQVGVVQEVRRVHRMVPYQAEQCRAVAKPVAVAQFVGITARQREFAHHVRRHAVVDAGKGRVRGVVQRVVEVEQPGP
jgi:hypothetical protein